MNISHRDPYPTPLDFPKVIKAFLASHFAYPLKISELSFFEERGYVNFLEMHNN
jgi:hypothetical protein